MLNNWAYFFVLLFACFLLFFIYYRLKKDKLSREDVIKLREVAVKERYDMQRAAYEDPPEIKRLQGFVNAYESNPSFFELLIAVGDIYQKGSFPRFLPNPEIAVMCYNTVVACPNDYISGIAQSKIMETLSRTIDMNDQSGKHLPLKYAYQICNMANEYLMNMNPIIYYEKPQSIVPETQRETVAQTLMEPTLNHFWSDAQNVHDHSVTKITQNNIASLKGENDVKPHSDEGLEGVIDSILNCKDVDAKVKEEALYVIDSLNDNLHGTYNLSELDALGLVWKKISSEPKDIKENMTETLTKQLASGIENGCIVCSSGKISRIISSLEGSDHVKPVRPLWALKEELANKAIQIRDKVSEEHGDDNILMKQMFEEEVNKEYIDTLGMSPDIIKPLILEYQQGFET